MSLLILNKLNYNTVACCIRRCFKNIILNLQFIQKENQIQKKILFLFIVVSRSGTYNKQFHSPYSLNSIDIGIKFDESKCAILGDKMKVSDLLQITKHERFWVYNLFSFVKAKDILGKMIFPGIATMAH